MLAEMLATTVAIQRERWLYVCLSLQNAVSHCSSCCSGVECSVQEGLRPCDEEGASLLIHHCRLSLLLLFCGCCCWLQMDAAECSGAGCRLVLSLKLWCTRLPLLLRVAMELVHSAAQLEYLELYVALAHMKYSRSTLEVV